MKNVKELFIAIQPCLEKMPEVQLQEMFCRGEDPYENFSGSITKKMDLDPRRQNNADPDPGSLGGKIMRIRILTADFLAKF